MSVTSSVLIYGCNGLTSDGLSVFNQNATKYPSNYFSYNTGFQYYVNQYYGVMDANLKVNLKQVNPNGTTRTWSFTTYNNLFNS